MPCTFSHPLAIVPLRRLCPRWLNFAALIIGSMSPDFGYYTQQFGLAKYAHTLPGSLILCLPAGLIILGLFYLIRRPVCFLLPQPHRTALMPLASRRPVVSLRNILVAALSVLIGAWSHNVWDSFTHDGAWAVQRIPLLSMPLLHVAGTDLPVSYLLQQFSTFSAGAALGVLYLLWLRKQRQATLQPGSDWWRYLLLSALIIISLAIAVPFALRMASFYEGYTAIRVIIFRTAIYSASAFVPLILLAAVTLHFVRKKRGYH